MEGHVEYIEARQIVACTACRHALWPPEIVQHFRHKKHNKMKLHDAQQIRRAAMQKHPDLIQDPQEWIHPSTPIIEIPQLKLHRDGFQCQVEPATCRAIRQTKGAIRVHCSEVHGRTTYSERGRPSKAATREAKAEGVALWREVKYFQRAFVQGPCSQYFEVRPRPRPEQQDATDTRDARVMRGMDRAIEDIIRAGDEAKANADRFIEEGSVDEANRWVDRTKWAQYLKGHQHEALLDLIEPPDPESEFVEAAIWSAMDGLGRFSQQTVARRAGLFVRFEAIRSEEQQTRYVPLMAYQDYAAIKTYIRPWKQVLMFFARTRKAEERRMAPKYRFTDTQKQAWRAFLYAAQDEARKAEAMAQQQGPQKTKKKRRRQRDNDEDESEGEEQQPEGEEEPRELTTIQKACLAFCIALLDQKHIHHDYDSAMVCVLAVLGVKSPGWKGVDKYPPILSKMIKIARFMVVQQAFEEVQPPAEFADEGYESDGEDYGSDEVRGGQVSAVSDGEEGGSEQQDIVNNGDEVEDDMVSDVDSAIDVEPPESKIGVIEAVRQMMDRFMVRGTAGPMQWMLDLRTYGLKIHYNTTTKGHVQWNEAQTLTYKGITIHMDAFRGFVHAVVNQTREFLRQRLLLGFEPPPIPWQRMRDDPSNEKSRWNFLQDERCQWPADGRRWLWDQIRASPSQNEAWYDRESVGMKRSRVDDYMDDVMEFRGLQLVAGHISQGGGVPRAPEMLSIRHENTPKGEHRNMFIEDGLVVWVTKYHKGYAISGDIKIIHRYLPRELGEVIVWYLWLVLPFQFALERKFYWKRPSEGTGKGVAIPPCPSTEQGVAIPTCPSTEQGVAIPTCPSTEQGVAIPTSPSTTSVSSTSVSSHLWPADHRGRQWTSARMRETLKRYSREHLGETLTIASYREIAIAISRQFLRECDAFVDDHDRVDDEGGGDGEGVGRRLQAIMDQQGGHTSHVAGSIYARLMEEMKGSVASSRERFRTASRMWHLWLGFASAENHSETYEVMDGGKRKPIESPWQAIVQQQRRAREVLLRSADVEQELRRMLKKKDAQFRGMQKGAIEAIVQGHPRIVVVMPTGEGKSFVFQLPAFIAPSGMTIVVVPLTELRRDMIQSCETLGIVAREWADDRQVDDATMVFVTPEAAAGAAFRSFMDRNQRKIDRIVIDECHVILNRRSNFRRETAKLGKLVRAGAQMVLVTATLPPSKQAELYERMYWKGLDVDDQHRMRTVRKNIRYSVHVVEKTARGKEGQAAHDDAVVRIAEAKVRQHQPGKIVVYANSVGKVIRLADQLGVDAYYSEAHLKSEMFQDFRSGRNPMIVATSALGLGIDIPDIRAVIHADTPRCLEEYSQESGRAGRDRQYSEAIAVVQAGEKGYNGGTMDYDEPETQALVERFIQGERRPGQQECRRRVLCAYFDEHERQRCEDGEEQCDVCAPVDELVDECSVEMVADVIPASIRTASTPTISVRTASVPTASIPTTSIPTASIPSRETMGVRSSQGVVEVVIRPEDVEASQRLQQDRAQAQRQRQEVIREAERELATFKRRVREWQRQCTLCAVNGGGEMPYDHSLWQCTAPGGAEAIRQMKVVQNAYRMENGAGCWKCLMPHSMCPRFVINERTSRYQFDGSRKCRHNGVIIAGCIGVLHSQRQDIFRQRWVEDMKSKGLTEEEAVRWDKGARLGQLMGKRVVLNDESVCEFALAFSKTIMRVEWALERTRMQREAFNGHGRT